MSGSGRRGTSGLCPARPWQPVSGRVPACASARASPYILALPALVWEEERAGGARNLGKAIGGSAEGGRRRSRAGCGSRQGRQESSGGGVPAADGQVPGPDRGGRRAQGVGFWRPTDRFHVLYGQAGELRDGILS